MKYRPPPVSIPDSVPASTRPGRSLLARRSPLGSPEGHGHPVAPSRRRLLPSSLHPLDRSGQDRRALAPLRAAPGRVRRETPCSRPAGRAHDRQRHGPARRRRGALLHLRRAGALRRRDEAAGPGHQRRATPGAPGRRRRAAHYTTCYGNPPPNTTSPLALRPPPQPRGLPPGSAPCLSPCCRCCLLLLASSLST